jgi:hypothetical protein
MSDSQPTPVRRAGLTWTWEEASAVVCDTRGRVADAAGIPAGARTASGSGQRDRCRISAATAAVLRW